MRTTVLKASWLELTIKGKVTLYVENPETRSEG